MAEELTIASDSLQLIVSPAGIITRLALKLASDWIDIGSGTTFPVPFGVAPGDVVNWRDKRLPVGIITPWVLSMDGGSVSAFRDTYNPPGRNLEAWPFPFTSRVKFTLSGASLICAHTITSMACVRGPACIGFNWNMLRTLVGQNDLRVRFDLMAQGGLNRAETDSDFSQERPVPDDCNQCFERVSGLRLSWSEGRVACSISTDFPILGISSSVKDASRVIIAATNMIRWPNPEEAPDHARLPVIAPGTSCTHECRLNFSVQ